MSNEIDWHEYEARKAQLKDTSPDEYERELRQIVKDLEREADERAIEEEEAEAAYV